MLLTGSLCGAVGPAQAQAQAQAQAPASAADDAVLQAREAFRRKDRNALAGARVAVNAARHPLALWVEYWELTNRLGEAQQNELDAFYARWPGSYVEDRLRNDWLLELGRRRDWVNLRDEFPRFRMNDDREVSCYALLVQHLNGQDVKAAARAAWATQKELDDGCALLGRTLVETKVLSHADAWQVARAAVEANRPRTARAAVLLVQPMHGQAIADALDSPARFLARPSPLMAGAAPELTLLALMRLAAADPEAAATQLDGNGVQPVPLSMSATAWAFVARNAAMKQQPLAAEQARRAWQQWESANKAGVLPPWSDDLLAWQVRAALRQPSMPGSAEKIEKADKARWQLVAKAIDAMGTIEQRDSAWVYWRARATAALSAPGPGGDAARAAARQALEGLGTQFNFYGKLAVEDLGGRTLLPPPPAPLTPSEREAARSNAGLTRALQLVAIGLRSEGVREWNFSLRGLSEREVLAAAQRACDREVWDRCINTSERTRVEIDINQRFPMPYREQVVAKARAVGLDPAVVYGLIRQESRFVADIRSSVGASGLMQLMPATAQWTARQIGLEYRPTMINDRDTNLLLGVSYLKRVLDDFGGSLALATAAYNAGPGRPRRWREGGAVMEAAAWAESIPFTETRDYVKKVLSNSVYYAALLAPAGASHGTPNGAFTGAAGSAAPALPTLKSRLGPAIGPLTGLREAAIPDTADRDRDRAIP